MKLFLVSADSYGYDEYDSFVIVAESKEQVQKILDTDLRNDNNKIVDLSKLRGITCMPDFSLGQEPVTIEEIKLEDCKIPTVICASFNAG